MDYRHEDEKLFSDLWGDLGHREQITNHSSENNGYHHFKIEGCVYRSTL